MATVYTFVKQILNPQDLFMVILQGGLSVPIDRVETLGTGEEMNIMVWFVDALSEQDQASLTNIVINYVNPIVTPNTLAAISSALNDDTKVVLLLRTKINADLAKMPISTIRNICTLLGIPF